VPRLPMPARAMGCLLLAFVAAGCGSAAATPAPSLLSDPNEIVTTSVGRFGAATSVHVDGTLSGSVNAASLGPLTGGAMAGLSGAVKLDGSSMSGDVDLARQALHFSAAFPRLFATTADVVVVDGFVYTKVNLLGDKYTRTRPAISVPSASPLPGKGWDVGAVFTLVRDASGATATLLGREVIDGGDAYHLVLTVPPATLNAELATLAGGPVSGVTVDTASIDYWVSVATVRPAKLEIRVSTASLGSIDATLTLSKYDQAVTITAPPAGQVQDN
jgi:hypothetical protein